MARTRCNRLGRIEGGAFWALTMAAQIAAAGCGAAPAPNAVSTARRAADMGAARLPSDGPPAQPGEYGLLIWGYPRRDGQSDAQVATPSTFFAAPDGVVTSRDGVHVAVDGAVYRFENQPTSIDLTLDCDDEEASANTDGAASARRVVAQGEGERAQLVPVDGRGRTLSVVAPPATMEAAEYRHGAELLASLGPYLFVVERAYGYSCGAHGGEDHRFVLFDLRTGGPASIYGADELEQLEREVMPRAREALIAELQTDDPGAAIEDEETERTMVMPTFDAEGEIGLVHQVTISSCYACSDGEWSSYTRSVVVSAERLPRLLETWAVPLRERLRAFAAGHRELLIRGVGLVAPEDFAIFATPVVPAAAREAGSPAGD